MAKSKTHVGRPKKARSVGRPKKARSVGRPKKANKVGRPKKSTTRTRVAKRVAHKATPKAKRKSSKNTRVLKTPASIVKHQPDYRAGAWMEYSQKELAEIVSYKATLATHYVNPSKRNKAIQDAHNYLDMLFAKVNA